MRSGNDSGGHEQPVALRPELLAQIKHIQLRAQRLVSSQLAGEYESAFKGRGMEFEEVRAYQPGDDIRHIDWNVTARTGAPHVKQHREERELTVMLLVDVSASGSFGSAGRLKAEVTAEAAAVLAYTAIRSNDRVGLLLFTDTVERYIPPKKGRSHIWRIIREILTFTPARRGTHIEAALDYLGRVVSRRAVVFVISDFLDSGYEERLRVVARRHELTAVSVVDPREEELPDVGIVELEDAESGERVTLDTASEAVRLAYAGAARARRDARRALLRSADIGEVEIHTDRPTIEPIVRYFHEHER